MTFECDMAMIRKNFQKCDSILLLNYPEFFFWMANWQYIEFQIEKKLALLCSITFKTYYVFYFVGRLYITQILANQSSICTHMYI